MTCTKQWHHMSMTFKQDFTNGLLVEPGSKL